MLCPEVVLLGGLELGRQTLIYKYVSSSDSVSSFMLIRTTTACSRNRIWGRTPRRGGARWPEFPNKDKSHFLSLK